MEEPMTNSAEVSNPVIDTARLTMSQLAAAGVPEATGLADLLGLKDFMGNYQVTGTKVSPLAVVQEARYSFVNRCIEGSGMKNVMDLACGFSPRGLVMARKGLNYLGCDLGSATRAMSQIVGKASATEDFLGMLAYRLTDITDPISMKEAAALLNGTVLMCCEGLLVYLGTYEYESMMGNISSVLHEHGGCFVTPDLVTAKFMAGIFTALLGDKEGMKALFAIAGSIERKSDTKFTGSVSKMPAEQMQELFEKHDLTPEYVPFFPEGAQLNSFAGLAPEQVERIRKNLADIKGLMLIPGKGSARNRGGAVENSRLAITCDGETMHIRLSGRLDSITAPVLLDEYAKASDKGVVADIRIDASGLEYISSAGLRVLLIMQKNLKGKRIRFNGAQDMVLGILRQTGFYDLLETD